MTVHNEINLKFFSLNDTICTTFKTLNQSDINGKAITAQLVVNNILHSVGRLQLSEIDNSITHTNVLEIIFSLCTYVFAPLYIIA